MKYELIAEKGSYALVQRGNELQQYAVVSGLNKETGEWDYTCSYYDFGGYSELSKEMALFKAVDDFLERTEKNHISHKRFKDIAGMLINGLVQDDKEEAYEYMCNVMELSEDEAEYLGLDMGEYRNRTEQDAYTPSSTGGDYGPSHPWDAPGMSIKDFI